MTLGDVPAQLINMNIDLKLVQQNSLAIWLRCLFILVFE